MMCRRKRERRLGQEAALNTLYAKVRDLFDEHRQPVRASQAPPLSQIPFFIP